jgi:folate-binding protein YgfZ
MTSTTVFELRPGVVVVEGADATSFLQSILSQDLDGIAVGEGRPALLLQPQGKLVATTYALRVGERCWWCVTDEGGGAALAGGLNRFRIRVKAEVVDVSDSFASLAVRGTGAADAVGEVTLGETRLIPRSWGPDVVGPRPDVARFRDELLAAGVSLGTDRDYDAARIAAGVPRLGADVDERTIPQEAFLERDAVSFTKGCFVGQELVCRIDTRGHVNRYLRRVHLGADGAPLGAELLAEGRAVGVITSVAGREALAMVRREVEPPAAVSVRFDDREVAATVDAL